MGRLVLTLKRYVTAVLDFIALLLRCFSRSGAAAALAALQLGIIFTDDPSKKIVWAVYAPAAACGLLLGSLAWVLSIGYGRGKRHPVVLARSVFEGPPSMFEAFDVAVFWTRRARPTPTPTPYAVLPTLVSSQHLIILSILYLLLRVTPFLVLDILVAVSRFEWTSLSLLISIYSFATEVWTLRREWQLLHLYERIDPINGTNPRDIPTFPASDFRSVELKLQKQFDRIPVYQLEAGEVPIPGRRYQSTPTTIHAQQVAMDVTLLPPATHLDVEVRVVSAFDPTDERAPTSEELAEVANSATGRELAVSTDRLALVPFLLLFLETFKLNHVGQVRQLRVFLLAYRVVHFNLQLPGAASARASTTVSNVCNAMAQCALSGTVDASQAYMQQVGAIASHYLHYITDPDDRAGAASDHTRWVSQIVQFVLLQHLYHLHHSAHCAAELVPQPVRTLLALMQANGKLFEAAEELKMGDRAWLYDGIGELAPGLRDITFRQRQHQVHTKESQRIGRVLGADATNDSKPTPLNDVPSQWQWKGSDIL